MFHHTNLGCFAPVQYADMQGFIPELSDGPWDLTYDHGSERTHNADETLTEYGEFWEEAWPAIRADAVAATEDANKRLGEWQESN